MTYPRLDRPTERPSPRVRTGHGHFNHAINIDTLSSADGHLLSKVVQHLDCFLILPLIDRFLHRHPLKNFFPIVQKKGD
jgi:hypothetical protein